MRRGKLDLVKYITSARNSYGSPTNKPLSCRANSQLVLKLLTFLFLLLIMFVFASTSVLAVDVSSCQDLNTADTTYDLTGPIDSNSGTCFNITADNITFDGHGYWVAYGKTGTGIAVHSKGSRQLTIKSLKINQTSTSRVNSPAIQLIDSYDNTITNNTLEIYGDDSPDAYNFGVHLENTTNTTVSASTFISSTTCDYCHAVYLNASSENNTMQHLNITTSGDYSRGIYAYSSDMNTIYNCTIDVNDYRGHGIYLYSSDNCTVNQTTISASGDAYAIYIQQDSDENLVTNSDISSTSNYCFHIDAYSDDNNITNTNISAPTARYVFYMATGSDRTFVDNTNILCNYDCIYGGLEPYVNGFEIHNSNISATGNPNSGIIYSSSGNNWLFNHTNITNAGEGYLFQIYGTTNNIDIFNSHLKTSGDDESVVFRQISGGGTVTIQDSIINASNDRAFMFTGGSRVYNLTNVSFKDKAFDEYSLGGTLKVFWYLDVYVNDSTGTDLNSANVTLYDNSGQQIFTQSTNSTGDIPRQIVLEYTQATETYINYSRPHTINVTLSGYHSKIKTVELDSNDLNGNRNLTITLTATSTPYLKVLSPVGGRTYPDTSVLVNITNSSNANNVWFIWQGSNYSYTTPTNFDFSTVGEHNITVYVNNSNGTSSETVFFNTSTGTIEVDSCRELDSPDIIYEINQSIASYSGTCFEIKADNITLDGKKGDGYTISYAISGGGRVVETHGYGQATIKNLNINLSDTTSASSHAIHLQDSQDNNLSNNTLDIYGGTYTDYGFNFGVYLYNTTNTTVEKNNITLRSNCFMCHGVYMHTSSHNTTIRDSIIRSYGHDTSPIYSYNSDQHTIQNISLIASTANYIYGAIRFYNSDNSVINQTDIYSTAGSWSWSIHLSDYSDNNLITNTNISTNSYQAIRIYDYSDDNNITNVNISSSEDSAIYIYDNSKNTYINNSHVKCDEFCVQFSQYSGGGILDNSNITANSGTRGTVYVWDSNNCIINNTNITGLGTGSYGFEILGASGTQIQNVNVLTTGSTSAYALYASNLAGTTTVKDSTLNASNVVDIYFNTGGGTINLTNTTFLSSYWSSGTPQLNVFWYLDAYVNDTTGSTVNNANLTCYDKNDNQIFTQSTNSSGDIPRQTILAYSQNSNTNVTEYTPHYINSTKTNYFNKTTSVEFDANKDITITLTGTTIPWIRVVSPVEGKTYPNTTVFVNITNSSNANNVWFIWQGSNYSYTTPTNFDFGTVGEHNITAYVNNSNGTNSQTVFFNTSTGTIQVDSCRELDSPDITYELNKSISSNSGNCFEIKADNITFNGQGYSLEYAASGTGKAFYATGYSQITIKNLKINQTVTSRALSPAIHIKNSQDNNISKNIIEIYGDDNPDAYNYGVHLDNTTNTTIEKNNITTRNPCEYCYGIFMEAGSHNTTIQHNIIKTQDYYSSGIYSHTSDQQTVYNNTLTGNSVFYGYIIDFYNTDNSIINQTTVTITASDQYATYGVQFKYYSDNNLLTNSVIDQNNPWQSAFYALSIEDYSDDNNVTHTNITSDSNYAVNIDDYSQRVYINDTIIEADARAIWIQRSINGIIDNSNLSHKHGSDGDGVVNFRSDSHGWILNNSNVTGGGANSEGIEIQGSLNLQVENTNVQTLGSGVANAFYAESGTSSATITDSIFNATNDDDFYFNGGSGTVNLTNTNFTENTWGSGTHNLHRFWHLKAYVNDSVGSPINGASVSARADSGIWVVQDAQTNSSGWTQRQPLLQYSKNSTATITYSNHTVRAEKANYLSSEQEVNFTSNKNLGFTLYALECGALFSVSGTYTLTGNLESNGTCFNIGTDNVIINCSHYNITGNSTGIAINNTGGYDNIQVHYCTLQNFSETIKFNNGVNATLYDSVIRNTSKADVWLGGTSNLTFLNVSFNKSGTNISGGNLSVKWFVKVFVNSTLGNPLENINVTVWDQYDSQQFTEMTNSSGYIKIKNLTEYYENSTAKYYYTNFTFNFTSAIVSTDTQYINLTTNKFMVSTLETKVIEVGYCSDGLDNDNDGYTDANDADCFCDRGNDSTTCWVNTSHSIPGGYFKLNNLVIQKSGVLQNTTRYQFIFINATGNITFEGNGTMRASNITLLADFVTLGVNSSINVSYLGYAGATTDGGDGAGTGGGTGHGTLGGAGAGYGGDGGDGGTSGVSIPGGKGYGSITNPSDLGSGGGAGNDPAWGGDGGGLIIINATENINITGNIISNGEIGTDAGSYSGGGGSGGAIHLTANTILGTGNITSNGGDSPDCGAYDGGGGAGGRIALTYTTNTFTGKIRAKGGTSGEAYYSTEGGAGTIYYKKDSWANYNLDRCMNITISNVGSTALTNFPAYINLTYDSDMLTDFTDIRFYSKACNNKGTELDYEIENYSYSDRAHIWTRIPSLPATGTIISIYYKNNTAIASGENAEGVWDENYIGVWHMSETSGNISDSTSNNLQGEPVNSPEYSTAGMVAGAGDFKNYGGDEAFIVPDNAILDVSNITVESWVYVTDDQNYMTFVCRDEGWQFNSDDANNEINWWSTENDQEVEGIIPFTQNEWDYAVAIVDDDGDRVELYVNAVSDANVTDIIYYVDTGGDLEIGDWTNNSGQDMAGLLDEIRISDIIRSADWINMSYQIVANQSTFVSFDSAQQIVAPVDGLIVNNHNRDHTIVTNITSAHTFNWANLTNASIHGAQLNITDNLNTLPGILYLNNKIIGTSNITIQNQSMLTHTDNNKTELYQLNITCKNIIIQEGATINTTEKGYTGGTTDGANGAGTGGGTGHVSLGGAGAGYGGDGGDGGTSGVSIPGGKPYGSITNPTTIGSGGGAGNSPSWGGDGGGLIIINATETINISGNIISNGQDGTDAGSYCGGGGSGGAIHLTANTILGTGNITTNGGDSPDGGAYDGGGGAGGRIALNYITYSHSGEIEINGGTTGGGFSSTAGTTGSLFKCKGTSSVTCPGTAGNIRLTSYFYPNSSMIMNRSIVLDWNQSYMKWNDSANYTTEGNYTFSGLITYRDYDIYNDTVKFTRKKADVNGTLPSFFVNISGENEIIVMEANITSTSLNFPIDNANLSSSPVTFNCTASSANGMKNITLYLNHTGWHANTTNDAFGNSNTTIFSKTLADGFYTWNCYGCDVLGSCNFSVSNRTFLLDTIKPAVTTKLPQNKTIFDTDDVNFTYSVSDSNLIRNCSFIVNGVINQTNSSITKDINLTFNIDIFKGNFNWTVNCTDRSSNVGTGGTMLFRDLTAPNVTLVSPQNNSMWSSNNVTFTYNVSDSNQILNCSLYINGVYNETDTSITRNTSQTFHKRLLDSNHNWTVNCTDRSFNDGTGGWFNFTNNDSQAPDIKIVYPANNSWPLVNTTTWANMNISTNENATCKYNLTDPDFDFITQGTLFTVTGVRNHSFNYSGLAEASTYNLYYKCNDTKGNNHTTSAHHIFGVAEGICDRGLYNTTCYINSSKEIDSPWEPNNVVIENGGVLSHVTNSDAQSYALNISCANFTIDSGGLINATGKGYSGGGSDGANGYGPGKGTGDAGQGGGGAGYGGSGGYGEDSAQSGAGGTEYGSLQNPLLLGSGGGAGDGTASIADGGDGGGLIIINATGSITINGKIENNGEDGERDSSTQDGGGGGSGGSIHLTAGTTFTGTGNITADGGDGDEGAGYQGGAGAGGRIAIYYTTKTYTGKYFSKGGTVALAVNGGAGTTYLKAASETHGGIIVNNHNTGNTYPTNLSSNTSATHNLNWANLTNATIHGKTLTILDNINILPGKVHLNNIINGTSNVTIRNQSTLSHSNNSNTQTYYLNLTCNNLTVDLGGAINTTGQGYQGGHTDGATGSGPGNGTGDAGQGGGGAGYGGDGGYGEDPAQSGAGGKGYGNIPNPLLLGSGGGAGDGTASIADGGNGGGLIIINATGSITINGKIENNGKDGERDTSTQDGGGGGSGGSIHLTAGTTFTGTGNITSNGGDGDDGAGYQGGGGAGGRIAIYYTTKTYTGKIKAYGGTVALAVDGGAGTIYHKAASETHGGLIINNYDRTLTQGITNITSSQIFNWANLTNTTIHGAELNITDNINLLSGTTYLNNIIIGTSNITIRNQSILTHTANTNTQTYYINLTCNNITIDLGGIINTTGQGYSGGSGDGGSGYGPGNGTGHVSYGGGGAGHGGDGGDAEPTGGAGGGKYNNKYSPLMLGSGGGAGDDTGTDSYGGDGGGLIIINATDTITINGKIENNGEIGKIGTSSDGGGGGSGGSTHLRANTFAGTGNITADGGDGADAAGYEGGGGAGGRIAILYSSYCNVTSFITTYTNTNTKGVGDQGEDGEDGTIFYGCVNNPPSVTLRTPSNNTNQPLSSINFSWNYNDENNDKQQTYHLIVDDNSDFSDPEFNISVNSTNHSKVLTDFNATTYYWKVRVMDNDTRRNESGNWSSWTDAWEFTGLNITIHWVNASPNPVAPGAIINITANITGSSLSKVRVYFNGSDYPMTNGGSGSLYWNNSISTSSSANFMYNVTANDTSGNEVNLSGNVLVMSLEITLNINPDPGKTSKNVTLSGHVNQSTGEELANHTVSIYFNETLYDYQVNNIIYDGDVWWNTSWNHRIPLTLDTGYTNRSNNTVVKKLVNFSEYGFTSIDGLSIRVADSSGTEMPSKVLRWVENNKTAMVQWMIKTDSELAKETNYTYYVYFDVAGSGKVNASHELPYDFFLCGGVDALNDFYYAYSLNNRSLPGASDWTAYDPPSVTATHEKDRFVIADINNDGKYDIIWTSDTGNAVYIHTANGSMNEWSYNLSESFAVYNYNWMGVCVGDYNEDGWTDIIANEGDCDVRYYQNDGDGTFAAGVTAGDCGSYSREITCGDFNNDGNMDVMAGAYSGGAIEFFQGRGDGTFSDQGEMDNSDGYGDDWHGMWAFDDEEDGDLDIIGKSATTYTTYFKNYGYGSFKTGQNLADGSWMDQEVWSAGMRADVDNDGIYDLTSGYWANTDHRLYVYFGPINISQSPSNILNVTFSTTGNAGFMECSVPDEPYGITISLPSNYQNQTKTDGSGDYSFTLTLPSVADDYIVNVTTTQNSAIGKANATLTVEQNYLNVSLNITPSPGFTNLNITVSGHVNDSEDTGSMFAHVYGFIDNSEINITDQSVWTDWWNYSWRYRKQINITENNGSALTDFQVRLTLDTTGMISDGNLQSDCDDIRVADSSGNKLYHWIENNCNTNATAVWIKANLTASSINTFYVYYGNTQADSGSDIDNVFIFGDDFSNPALKSNWTEVTVGGASLGTFSDGKWNKSCNGECDWWSTSALDAGAYVAFPSSDSTWEAITLMTSWQGPDLSQMGLMLYQATTDGYLGPCYYPGAEYHSVPKTGGGITSQVWYTNITNTIHYKIQKMSGNAAASNNNFTFWISEDGTTWSRSGYNTYDIMGNVGLYIKDWTTGATSAEWEHFLIKKYVESEPTQNATGTEQHYISADSNGDYNFTFTAPISSGDKTIKVNASYLGVTGQSTDTLTINPNYINITLNAAPNPGYTSRNVTISGYVNESDGSSVKNHGVNIFIADMQQFYNETSGYLENTSRWWNTSWLYRTEIQEESFVSTNMNQTIVMINMSTSDLISAGKMKSNCGDVRLVINNEKILNHTIETSTCNSDNTIFWAWMNLTANENTTLYAYYGNTGASLPTDYTNPDQNLMLYMHFDNSSEYGESNTLFYDFSKNGNNGTCTNCPTLNSTGKYGGSYKFDGGNDYIEINNSASLNITGNQITLGAWLYFETSIPNNDGVIFKGPLTNSQGVYQLNVGNDGTGVHFRLNGQTGEGSGQVSSGDLPNSMTSSWHHIVATYNGSLQSLYIDGELNNTASYGSSINADTNSLKIGVYYSSSYPFDGQIDEVFIYNRSLSADEILSIYNSSKNHFIANHSIPKTNSSGDYNYVWKASAASGIYTVIANTTYRNASNNQTLQLTIEPPPTEIDSCQNLDAANSNYELNKTVNSSGSCFNIQANNITLNCGGYNVTWAESSVGYGVNNSDGYNNITIKNCIFEKPWYFGEDYSHAVYMNQSLSSTMFNNTVRVYYGSGFRLENSHKANITQNDIYSVFVYADIYLSYSNNATIDNNTLTTAGNRAWWGNTPKAVYLGYSKYAELYNNTITTDEWTSVDVLGSETAHYNHTIGQDNTLNNMSVRYIAMTSDTEYRDLNWSNLDVVVVNCTNLTFENITFDHIAIEHNTVNITVENSTIQSSVVVPLSIYVTTDVKIKNNVINHTGNAVVIPIRWSSTDLDIINNTILNTGTSVTIRQAVGVVSFNLYNNTINSTNAPGIYTYPSGAGGNINTIEGNTIYTAGASDHYGIYTDMYLGTIVITKNTITSSGPALHNNLDYDSGQRIILINDSILNSTGSYDVQIDDDVDGVVNLTNVTLGNNNITFGTGGTATVNVLWYIQVYVNDTLGADIPSATVNMWDTNSDLLIATTTNSTGWTTAKRALVNYFQNVSANFTHSNYTINASKTGYLENTTVVNLTTNTISYIMLTESIAVSCGNLDSADTTYTLTENINSSGSCFNILADNITINCGGFNINYSQSSTGYAVNNSDGHNYTNVRNCNITQGSSSASSYGIYYYGADNGTINNNTITAQGATSHKIYFFSSNLNNITNNNITSSSTRAIYFGNSERNLVNANILESTSWILDIYINSDNNTISNNIIKGGGHGINTNNADYNQIINNNISITGSGGVGVYIWSNSEFNNITNNNITTTGTNGDGVKSQSDSNRFKGNIITTTNSNAEGIYVQDWDDNIIIDNNITTSSLSAEGIELNSATNTTIINNSINAVNAHAIYVNPSATVANYNHLITGNTEGGYPIYYYFNNDSIIIEDLGNLGQLIVAASNNVTVRNISLRRDGIHLALTENSTVQNNNITTTGTRGYGIYLYDSADKNNISNNNITTTGTQSSMIDMDDASDNNINNNILISSTISSSIPGIILFTSTNSHRNNINNNQITSSGIGIQINNGCDNNTLDSNQWVTTYTGISIISNSIVTNNNISTSGSNAPGTMIGGTNNIFTDNNITTSNTNAYGIRINTNANNNTLTRNQIKTTGSGAHGIYFLASYNNTFYDSVINATNANDLYFSQSGNANFTNVTFNKSDVSLTLTAKINVFWYMDVYVNDSGGADFNNANVTAWDNNSNQVFTELTNSTGWVTRKTLLEYWQNNSETYTYSNYTVNASNTSYTTDTEEVNLTTNTIVYLTLSQEGGINCSDFKCMIIRASGSPAAIFDGLGAVDLASTLAQSSSGSPGSSDFIVRDSSGTPRMWVNTSGGMSITGTLSQNNGGSCTPPAGSFFIMGNNSECVAYVNATGDLWLRGVLRENAFS